MNTVVEVTVAQRGEGLKARRVRRNARGVSVRVRSERWRCDGVDGNRSGRDGRQGRSGTKNAEICY